MTLPPQLTAIVTALRPPAAAPTALSPQSRLDELGLDSLDRIRLAAALEATYGITIPDTALADAHQLGDLATIIDTDSIAATALVELVDVEEVPVPRPAPEQLPEAFLHPTAELGTGAQVGLGSRVWHQAQLADGVQVGSSCVLGKGVYLGTATRIGNRVKIQNAVQVFGADIHDEVLLCPGVVIVEDHAPRAVTVTGAPQVAEDWTPRPVTVGRGATIGAGAILLPGIRIGAHALVAAGSVVDRDVPPHALVAGNPHRHIGWVCRCGQRLPGTDCSRCGAHYQRRTLGQLAEPTTLIRWRAESDHEGGIACPS
jgi:acetyltransferase-like isoleucine patch superfamily enzyme/acyl carrier protein